MKNNSLDILINYYNTLIVEKLKEADIADVVILRILSDLETKVYDDMAEDVVNSLTEDELLEVDKIESNKTTSVEDVPVLGLAQKDVSIEIIHQLEKYLHDLPENLSAIKEQYSNSQ